MPKFILLSLLLAIQMVVFSQEIQDIETDRPDQTECSSVIPLKTIQIETGIVQESDKETVRIKNLFFPTTLIRIGVFSKLEFRIIAGEYFISDSYDDSLHFSSKGFSPFSFGTKVFICKENKFIPQTALLFHFNHDNSKFSLNKINCDFRFSMSHTLTDKLDLGYNLGGEWDWNNNSFVYIYTLTTAYSLSEKFGSYVEVFGDAEKNKLPHHQFDAGITFLPRKNLQIDCSAGIALNKNSTDQFLSAGLSWRIPK